MSIIKIHNYLIMYDDILMFPSYIRYINKQLYNIDNDIIDDYLLMYGKVKPCITNYTLKKYIRNNRLVINRMINKYKMKKNVDYIKIKEEYLMSPKLYYNIIYSSNNIILMEQFNKLFIYEHYYNIYLMSKNQ